MPPAPSLSNIFGSAPAAGGTPPPAPGPSLSNIFGTTAAPKASPSPAPTAAAPSTDALVASTPKAPDTSSLFSKFTGFLGSVGGKISKAISDATSPPTMEKQGTDSDVHIQNLGPDANANTLKFLPSELARQIPGVADLQDNPDLAKYITPSEVLGSVPTALGEVASGFAKAPIKAVADVWDAGRTFLGLNPDASFTVPGLGKVTSDIFDVHQAVMNGEDPVVAALNAGSSSIFNTLFFTDIMNRAVGPRNVKMLDVQGNTPEGAPTIPAPKTGRLYEEPTAYNKGGAHVLPPEALEQMKSQGITLPKSFNPEQPVFFKTTLKGDTYTGEMYQVKPSLLRSLFEKTTGTKTPTDTLPALLGKEPIPPTEALSSEPMSLALAKVPAEDTEVLHTQEVKGSDLVTATSDAIKENEPETPAVTAPEPTVSTSLTVSHNAVRLLDGDTSQAHVGAGILEKEIEKAIDSHGLETTAAALSQKLGVDEQTAAKLVSEVQAKNPADAAKVLQNIIGAPGQSGINPNQATKLSAEEARPLAEKLARAHYAAVHSKNKGLQVIGGDQLKDYNGKDYNNNNHPAYSQAAGMQFTRALKENRGKKVYFTGGGPASGKTEIVTEALKSKGAKGIVYDSNLSNFEGAKRQIEEARAAGKHVEIHGVLPDLEASRRFTIQRENAGKHGIEDATFARGHAGFPATLEKLLADGIIDAKDVYLLDTRGITDYKEALSAVFNHEYVNNPLEVLRTLGYDEATLKETYAKRHFNNETGQRESGLPERGASREASTRDRADQENADRRGDEGILAKTQKEVKRQYPTIHQGGVVKMVTGEPVHLVDGIDTFIHKGDGGYIVSEATTGRFLAESRSEEGAIAKAKFNIEEVGKDKFAQLIAQNKLPETARELHLKSEQGKKEKTTGPGNTQVPVTEINGERVETPPVLVSKTDLKNMINTLPDKKGSFAVVEKDGQMRLELDTPHGHMSLRPSALGLVESQLKVGDVIHVDAKDLQPKGTSFRVTNKDNKIEAMGGSAPRGKRVTPSFGEESIAYSGDFGDTDKIPARIKAYTEDIESLERHLASTSRKDGDVREEIKEEIQDKKDWIEKAQKFFEKNNPNRGFASLDAIAKVMDKADAGVKDFVENTLDPIKMTENVTDSLVKLEGAAQADLEGVNKLFSSLEIDRADDEALYAHAENPDAPLTDKQKALAEKFDTPLKEANEVLFRRIKGLGVPIDDESTYIARFPKDRPSVMQRLFKPSPGRTATAKQGSVLSKTTSSLKKRTMKILTDSEGNRTVVAIKDNRVTAFKDKKTTDLGPLAGKVTTKVKEFFDPAVRGKLEKLARDLGITHERHATGRTEGLGGKRAGVSFQGENLIKTRMSQDSVLAHEIGHQIDHKYGLQAVIKDDQYDELHRKQVIAEMRELADQRFAGAETTESFKHYVRQGSEKMAVMFEAYISNKQLFKDVAPHLYDSFIDFISSHKELRPFLDIKGSLGLESKINGGEHIAGKNGSTFIDSNGKKYTIGDATTQEIEQHTNIEYYHSAVASRLMQYVKLRQIDRATQFLESWKESPDFAKVAVKNDEIPPNGWKMTNQINFRNYYFEPRVAEALDDFQGMLDSGNYNDFFKAANRMLANAIFFNGLAHPINVAVTWAYQRGASSLVNPAAYTRGLRAGARALKAMSEKNADYMTLLKEGAHLMSSDVSNKTFAENVARRLGDAVDNQPEISNKIMKILGYTKEHGNPLNFKTFVIYKISHDWAWLSNDFFTLQSIFEAMERDNISMPEAIKQTSRFIPDYRQQSRLLDVPLTATLGKQMGGATARSLAKVVYNRNIAMFGSYHVGLMQSLWNSFKDTAGAGKGFSKEENVKRAQGADKLAMLALLMVVFYPWLDKEAQKLTGSSNTYITRSGVTKYPYLAYKWATGQTTGSQAVQQVITPAVGTELVLEQLFDHDFFTGNQLSGPGGEGRLALTLNAVAPYSEFQRVASGKESPADFALTFLGVHTPKNTQSALDLNAMIYTEKPQVDTQAKAHINAGDEAGALALVTAFNDRLSAQIRKVDAVNGPFTPALADARVQYFLNQYGLRMPGALALSNYAAKQGKNIAQKTLPNGQPDIPKNTPVPETGVISAITTYAKAIGTDPIEAFGLIFSGQSIRNVENGAIIVNRMSLADSQKIKTAEGGNNPNFKLDHIVPLEGGGDNSDANLQLIPTAQWQANTQVENYIGAQLAAGNMSKDQAREVAIRFKAGQGEILSPALQKEYTDKYGGKPLTLDQVYSYLTDNVR